MEGYEVRMKVEFSQLDSKIKSLKTFIDNQGINLTISETEYDLLIKQLDHMCQYLDILKQRCNIHSINI